MIRDDAENRSLFLHRNAGKACPELDGAPKQYRGNQTASKVAQQLDHGSRIANGVPVPIVIEIRPHLSGAALADFRRPPGELLRRIIVAIPLLEAMEADVDVI